MTNNVFINGSILNFKVISLSIRQTKFYLNAILFLDVVTVVKIMIKINSPAMQISMLISTYRPV